MADLFTAIAAAFNEYGPIIVLLAGLLLMNAFFVFRDFQRERHQQAQLEALQLSQNEVILPLLAECKEAIASCKEVISQNSIIINGFLSRGGR